MLLKKVSVFMWILSLSSLSLFSAQAKIYKCPVPSDFNWTEKSEEWQASLDSPWVKTPRRGPDEKLTVLKNAMANPNLAPLVTVQPPAKLTGLIKHGISDGGWILCTYLINSQKVGIMQEFPPKTYTVCESAAPPVAEMICN